MAKENRPKRLLEAVEPRYHSNWSFDPLIPYAITYVAMITGANPVAPYSVQARPWKSIRRSSRAVIPPFTALFDGPFPAYCSPASVFIIILISARFVNTHFCILIVLILPCLRDARTVTTRQICLVKRAFSCYTTVVASQDALF